MRVKDINSIDSFSVWAEIYGADDVSESAKFMLSSENAAFMKYAGLKGIYSLFYGGNNFLRVKIIEDSSEITLNNLNHYISRGGSCLAEAVISDSLNRIQLRLVFFSGLISEFGDIEIGISEKTAENASSAGVSRENSVTEKLCGELAELCQITAGGDKYFAVRTCADFSGHDEEGEISAGKNFQVCGNSLLVTAENKSDSGRNIFSASRTLFTNRRIESALTLAHGKISFTDHSKASQIMFLAAHAMEKLTSSPESYLKAWEIYAQRERQIAAERAQKIGMMRIISSEIQSGFMRFFAEGINIDELHKDDCLEFVNDDTESKDDGKSTAKIPFYEVLSVHPKYIDLKTDTRGGDFLKLSTQGDDVMHKRRSNAIAMIKAGRCANPLLGVILEKGGVLPKSESVPRIKPLTPMLEGKIFRYPPTEKQREAIDIALNTPDIALIQGPPGTGKTTVITAIIERLNQEFDKRGVSRGQVLVSAFQHDAVSNIVGRLSVNSLPAYKFGGRNDPDSERAYDSESEIEQWCVSLSERIRQKYPKISGAREFQELDSLINAYCESPSNSSALSLMNKIISIPKVKASPEIFSSANAIILSLKSHENEDTSPAILRKIFALRTTKAGFLDDGAERAIDLYESLSAENYGVEDSLTLLRMAGMWDKDIPPDFLADLAVLRRKLIAEFRPSARYVEEKTRSDVLSIAGEAAAMIKSQSDSYSESEKILADFLLDIENNPEGIREAVKDYQFVYSATVQQSVGKEIFSQVSRSGDKNSFYSTIEIDGEKISFPVYDTVIIDEAARPLPMDLLIPMAQGRNRIILVGDHRQLPHIIDEDIAGKIESGQTENGVSQTHEYLERSMFSYLFSRLKDLEASDGIKRTVTLDSQYRMNPLLGDFVSRNFYDPYGEGFKSPVSAENFSYSLPNLNGTPAIWLDVPSDSGPEVKQGTSRARKAEADVIAEYISSWLKSESGKKYTFGVISFYAAQRDLIQSALERKGIRAAENKSRLQVGTVDSFQGKEFDIVILSAVRMKKRNSPAATFGHLMSENRLCVSMSRQKRALIVAGCAELFSSDYARENVPAMYNFYGLCRKEGLIVNA